MGAPSDGFVPFDQKDIEQSVADRFEQQVGKYPDRVAMKDASGSMTYDELNRAVNRVAWAILDRLGPGEEPVGLVLDSGMPMLIGIFAALKAGKIYVPLDPAVPSARTAYILEDSGAVVVVTGDRRLDLARQFTNEKHHLVNMDRLPASAPSHNPRLEISPDRLAYILYTSGSTGRPKGVVHNHRNILQETRIHSNGMRITSDDRISVSGSYAFSASIRRIYPALLNGGLLCGYDAKGNGIAGMAEWMLRERITIQGGMRADFNTFISGMKENCVFPDLRILKMGGDTIYRDYVDRARRFIQPGCKIVIAYGTTEGNTVTQYFLDRDTEIYTPVVPVGYAADGLEIQMRREDGSPADPGEEAEVFVRTRFNFTGYWNKPELTAKALLPDPEGGDRRIWRTGDLGRMDEDGLLMHLGRRDFQLKIRGYTIQAGEVENALREMDCVDEVRVVGGEDPTGGKRLVAYLTTKVHPAPTVTDLRRALNEKVPEYMVPSVFVVMDKMPMTATGKVDRKALPAPESVRPNLATPYIAPRNETEQRLAGIWSGVLGIGAPGVMDNFFDLGGHSLAAAQMLTEIETAFNKRFPLRTVLQFPMISELAVVLKHEQASASKPSCLVAVQTGGAATPFFCVPWAGGDVMSFGGLARLLGPDQPFYGLQPKGMDDSEAPHATVAEMVDYYLKSVREFQPRGPYLLGGRCFGGLVAFEMARRLREQGEKVPLLVLIDSSQPGPRISLFNHTQRLLFHHLPRGRLLFCLRSDIREMTKKLKRRFVPRTEDARLNRVWAAHDRARLAYVPGPFDGRITLFHSEEFRTRFPDYENKWQALASGGVECCMVPGRHRDMLLEPNLQIVAGRFKAALEAARTQP